MRRRKGARSASIMIWVLLCGDARATDAVELSLEQALERAESTSPLLRLAKQARAAAASLAVGAGIVLPSNPVLTGGLGRRGDASGSMPAARGLEWSARLEQSFELGGQRSARLSEVERGVDLASARERLARAETRARVRAQYVALLLGRAYLASAQERERLAERVLESARARVAAGAAGDVELHLAEAEHARLSHERIDAELAIAEGESALALLLALPTGTALVLTSALGEPERRDQSLEALEGEARQRREELRALHAASDLLAASIVRLLREAIPNPSVFVELAGAQPGQFFVGGGVALPLPLFRRNQGELAFARANKARTEEELQVVEREVASEVARAYRALGVRRAEVKLWNDTIVPASNQNVELVSAGWRAGKFDFFRVVQVLREAGEARRRQLEVLGQLWQVSIELDRATGRP